MAELGREQKMAMEKFEHEIVEMRAAINRENQEKLADEKAGFMMALENKVQQLSKAFESKRREIDSVSDIEARAESLFKTIPKRVVAKELASKNAVETMALLKACSGEVKNLILDSVDPNLKSIFIEHLNAEEIRGRSTTSQSKREADKATRFEMIFGKEAGEEQSSPV